MNLFENYNTAKQKYGEIIVKKLSDIGIPPQYLLSACRFYQDNQVPIERIQQLFRQWMTYVVNNNNSIDVNKLTFEQFYQTIQKSKSSYEIPNKIFDNGTIQIGEFKNFKEASVFPIPNNMCVCKTNKWFKYYQSPHSRYLLIHDCRRNDNKRYVLAIIEHGEISYADLSGHEFANSFGDQERGNVSQTAFDQYQQSIGKEAVGFLYNIAADVKDKIDIDKQVYDSRICKGNLVEYKHNNNHTNMTKKQVIRLTESGLHRIIKESVNKILNEISIDKLQRAQDKAFDEYDSMWPDDENYDEDFVNKRKRQYDAFKDRIHQLNSEGGKNVYYIVIPGVAGFYNGQVRKVYMTQEEALQYEKEHNGHIYTSFVEANNAADCLS